MLKPKLTINNITALGFADSLLMPIYKSNPAITTM
jgi:hypothetical protein